MIECIRIQTSLSTLLASVPPPTMRTTIVAPDPAQRCNESSPGLSPGHGYKCSKSTLSLPAIGSLEHLPLTLSDMPITAVLCPAFDLS